MKLYAGHSNGVRCTLGMCYVGLATPSLWLTPRCRQRWDPCCGREATTTPSVCGTPTSAPARPCCQATATLCWRCQLALVVPPCGPRRVMARYAHHSRPHALLPRQQQYHRHDLTSLLACAVPSCAATPVGVYAPTHLLECRGRRPAGELPGSGWRHGACVHAYAAAAPCYWLVCCCCRRASYMLLVWCGGGVVTLGGCRCGRVVPNPSFACGGHRTSPTSEHWRATLGMCLSPNCLYTSLIMRLSCMSVVCVHACACVWAVDSWVRCSRCGGWSPIGCGATGPETRRLTSGGKTAAALVVATPVSCLLWHRQPIACTRCVPVGPGRMSMLWWAVCGCVAVWLCGCVAVWLCVAVCLMEVYCMHTADDRRGGGGEGATRTRRRRSQRQDGRRTAQAR